ncbi:hypothetical protein SAMN04489751_3571 [Brevibacterium sandarakinum]|uniref:Uncharacterized protein n=1 Tax=Brevibacterium sandarakinum TaxID=629680 RepID=A0A1H1X3C1_BRESA|nr:hypothetical protein [Brevibacterium sandarakinum]SDT03570.1 hypothetical protein SAMN04489751_3571 [Brevibacterium sandarakinum]
MPFALRGHPLTYTCPARVGLGVLTVVSLVGNGLRAAIVCDLSAGFATWVDVATGAALRWVSRT